MAEQASGQGWYDVTFIRQFTEQVGVIQCTSVVLERVLRLPFVPVEGMFINFDGDFDYYTEERHLERVMWHVGSGRFIALFQDSPTRSHIIKALMDEGWNLRFDFTFSTRSEAEGMLEEDDNRCVVERAGFFYRLTPTEIEMLEYIDSKKKKWI